MAKQSRGAEGAKTALKPFKVTVRVFDPTTGVDGGQEHVLPVDIPT